MSQTAAVSPDAIKSAAQKLDAYHSAASHDVPIGEVFDDWGEAG